MAGKWCKSNNEVPRDHKLAAAYCAGREAAANGGSTVDNPHPQGYTFAAWVNGFNSWTDDPAGWPRNGDCCANPPGGGYVEPEPDP